MPAKECFIMLTSSPFKIKLSQGLFCLLVMSFNAFSQLSLAAIADKDFVQCKTNLIERANLVGLSMHVTQQIIPSLQPIKRVIALDKKQPEFTQSFENYIKARVTDYHIRVGKEKLTKHERLFNRLERDYGIPRQYLVSFWGLETVYGKHKGKMNVLNALVTLACDQRRSEFFTLELLNLFTLIDSGKVTVEQLKGSWAGAMGHMQFMPTALLKYAIDADNDGKVDIWQSEEDALTTAANYLQKIGWQAKERWGRQVKLPENFAFNKVMFDQYYPLSFFESLGVKQIDNKALPSYDIEAELYLPSGYKGPAFLLYPNFNVIMTWNLSRSYALSVGLLANKLIGTEGIIFERQPQNKQNQYTIAEMKVLQQQLNQLGFVSGEPDGIWGPKSRKAIKQFQLKESLIADGYPNEEVFLALQKKQKTAK